MVMDAARAAGAAGGTVIHAKGTGAMSAKKFFGLSIAAEKEMVFIVAKTADKKDIMRAIVQNAGADSEANALVFSLPVNDTAGFRLMED
jgi:nitrogen regulatory protein PII